MTKKLTIEIPDWAEGRPVHVFIAKESYMHVGADGRVWKKTVRCDRCGKCCRLKPESSWPFAKYEIDGHLYCIYVIKEMDGTFSCGAPLAPFSCCSDNPSNRKHKGKAHLECCIEYELIGSIQK